LVLLLLLRILLRLEEFDFTLEHRAMGAVVRRALFVFLLSLLVFFLARRFNDAETPSPWDAGAESHAHPLLNWLPRPLHDDVDVVQRLSFASNQSTRIGFLQRRVLEHSQAYPRGPLNQGVVRVKVQQVPVAAGGTDA